MKKQELSIATDTEGDGRQEKLANALNNAESGLHRVVDIVKNITILYGIDKDEKELCDINYCIRLTVDKLQKKGVLSDNVNLKLGVLPQINISVSKIKQVLHHLLTNASQASPKDGAIVISSTMLDNYIEIRVADKGCGIPEHDLDKVFDIHYTTKKSNDGTGLGLAISHAFVREHYGDLSVFSTQGKGSEFVIRLPISEKVLH